MIKTIVSIGTGLVLGGTAGAVNGGKKGLKTGIKIGFVGGLILGVGATATLASTSNKLRDKFDNKSLE